MDIDKHVPGVFVTEFKTVTDEMATGSVVMLGFGKVQIAIGDCGPLGMLMFLPVKTPVDPRSPVLSAGTPAYDAARNNIEGGGLGSVLFFKDLDAVDNLRRSLDSVEKYLTK